MFSKADTEPGLPNPEQGVANVATFWSPSSRSLCDVDVMVVKGRNATQQEHQSRKRFIKINNWMCIPSLGKYT